MTWKKITEKNTIVPGKGEEFDMDGKKIAVFNQMVIMHWTEYAYIKTTQSLQANLTVIL